MKILRIVVSLGLLFAFLFASPFPVKADSNSTSPQPQDMSALDKQIAKDLLVEKPDLTTLLRQYYYYRHNYNTRAGVNAFVWLVDATIWQPTKTVWTTLWGLKNTYKIYELGTKWMEFIGALADVKNLALRGNFEDAAVLMALNMPDERLPIPFASLAMGIGKTEYVKWRADTLYSEVLEKLKTDQPSYCVFRETYQGKNYCYKSWKDYWQVFKPASMLSSLPRGLEEYNKAALRWQEKTKFGEFSDGEKYTVKEIVGEEWKDAFEDMNWVPQKYEVNLLKPEKKVTDTSTSPSETIPISPSDFPPIYPNAVKVGKEFELAATDIKPLEACQAYAVKEPNNGQIDDWYSKQLLALGWKMIYGDQLLEFRQNDGESFMAQVVGQSDWNMLPLFKEIPDKRELKSGETGFLLCWSKGGVSQSKPTPSPTKIILPSPTSQQGADKTMTVAEFLKLPENAAPCYGANIQPIRMQLEIAKYVEFELEKYYHYEGKDDTGVVDVYLFHFDKDKGDWIVPIRKFEVGKTYLFQGCTPYVGTGGPGPGPLVFGVDEAWENSIKESL